MMLVLAPERVDMSRAVRDIHERKSFRLTRDPGAEALYSPTGVYGDATLATRAAKSSDGASPSGARPDAAFAHRIDTLSVTSLTLAPPKVFSINDRP